MKKIIGILLIVGLLIGAGMVVRAITFNLGPWEITINKQQHCNVYANLSTHNCTTTGIALINANNGVKDIDWECDYGKEWECKYNATGKNLICDSRRDGNADGICQSGETCLQINMTKEGIKKIKNIGFSTVLDKYEIKCNLV